MEISAALAGDCAFCGCRWQRPLGLAPDPPGAIVAVRSRHDRSGRRTARGRQKLQAVGGRVDLHLCGERRVLLWFSPHPGAQRTACRGPNLRLEGPDGCRAVFANQTRDLGATKKRPAGWAIGKLNARSREAQPNRILVNPWPISGSPLVVHRELKARIRRKQLRHFPQPLGHLLRSQQRVVALAQIVVIHVEE
jgi:hypothetical protein